MRENTGKVTSATTLAIEPVVAFMRKAESISWAIKILDKIATNDLVVGYLLELLGGMDTEYQRDPERKNQILSTLAERKDPRILLYQRSSCPRRYGVPDCHRIQFRTLNENHSVVGQSGQDA